MSIGVYMKKSVVGSVSVFIKVHQVPLEVSMTYLVLKASERVRCADAGDTICASMLLVLAASCR